MWRTVNVDYALMTRSRQAANVTFDIINKKEKIGLRNAFALVLREKYIDRERVRELLPLELRRRVKLLVASIRIIVIFENQFEQRTHNRAVTSRQGRVGLRRWQWRTCRWTNIAYIQSSNSQVLTTGSRADMRQATKSQPRAVIATTIATTTTTMTTTATPLLFHSAVSEVRAQQWNYIVRQHDGSYDGSYDGSW